jgi:hypothetical protein
MHGASQAGVKGMDSAKNFERPLWIGDGRIDQCSFISAALAERIAGAGVPRGGNNGLVVDDLLVLDFDPMAQGAAWCFFESEAGAGFRPALRIPFVTVMDTNVAVRHIVIELRDPFGQLFDHDVRFDCAGSDAAES